MCYVNMYTYIYSTPLQKKKYEKELAEIETSLGVYGIAGDLRRLSNFLTLEGIIRDVLKKRDASVVIVGDDVTAWEALNLLAGTKANQGKRNQQGEHVAIQRTPGFIVDHAAPGIRNEPSS